MMKLDAGADGNFAFAAPMPVALPPQPRRRLWGISPKHHCSLLGAAFDARELRQLFRRAGYADWRTASDYALHSSAVCFASDRNDFSSLAQRALEKRFAAAAYWAALSHPELDADAEELLSREMHMSAHAQFAARRGLLRRARALEARVADLAARQAALRDRLDAARQENRELQAVLETARREALQARAELERWRSSEIANELNARHAELEAYLAAARAERDGAQRALRDAMRRLERLRSPGRQHAIARPPDRPAPVPAVEAASPPDLDGRRLLCIGGKKAVVAQYRAIVESAGGEFVYHDGGIEDHVGRLSPMLASADAVVCLAGDCSHAAYRLAKRYCKAKGKQCALIGNSSVTALARCISERFPANDAIG
ncbi:MAG: hypothetical protein A3G81_23915 [Betaproteobacteria bacterium RIFCSPLOWO2_12_FULL_65_14]|nr:MAG: hypothetical protein A3G81_23915 [Betaproteobacteria bacterium RIFCSPLOWO2_12_FULL_65_14]